MRFPSRSALSEFKQRVLFGLRFGYLWVRSWLARKSLPPGDLAQMLPEELKNRAYLLQRAQRLGPVFKVVHRGALWICVVGLSEARRLLLEHSADLQPQDIDLTALFPEGHLSLMAPEQHHRYRRAFVQAIDHEHLLSCASRMQEIAAVELASYAHNQQDGAQVYLDTLRRISTQMLLEVLLGAPPDSQYCKRLLAGFQSLGPEGLVWHPRVPQREAFNDLLREIRATPVGDLLPGSLLANLMHNEIPPDRAILGNLIYMVEMGRSDLHHLFRWLSKFAAMEPAFLQRLQPEPYLARPFVLESLRMAQAEVVMRSVRRDFVFLDLFWPKGAVVRVCLWEAHNLESSFADPFTFNPARFGEEMPRSVYAPFGLDAYGCPFQGTTTQLSEAFLRALSLYRVLPIAEQGSRRGRFHWEPAPDFSVRLESQGAG